MHVCMYACIYTYACITIHIYIYIHIHIQGSSSQLVLLRHCWIDIVNATEKFSILQHPSCKNLVLGSLQSKAHLTGSHPLRLLRDAGARVLAVRVSKGLRGSWFRMMSPGCDWDTVVDRYEAHLVMVGLS